MPIYEYECKKCGIQTEVLQKFSDKPITKCELCEGKMKKLISHNTFHLKGSGWYVTDYASKTNKSNKSSEQATTDTTPKKEAKSASEKPKTDGGASTSNKTKKNQ